MEGVWVSDPGAIKMAFLEFYKEKFSCHDSPMILPSMSSAKSLSDSDRHLLDYMVSLEEIKNAVWDCGSKKDPGPDGFSFLFVKKYWDIMKIDIQNFVVRFFSSSSFPPGANSLFFTLIPKIVAKSSKLRAFQGFSSTWRKWIKIDLVKVFNGLPSSSMEFLQRGQILCWGFSSDDIKSMAAELENALRYTFWKDTLLDDAPHMFLL
ncbi:hypothetical protein Tco_0269883 [Tanacetum coccineum]